MKVKVLQTFRDRHTKEIHKADKEMEISKERFEEILTVGELVEEIKEAEKDEVKDEIKAPSKKARKTSKKKSE